VATGGSVVYSDLAMRHLKASGIIIYLELPLPVIEARLTNIESRGVVMGPQQTLANLHDERRPLYLRYADITINCADLTHEQVLGKITEALGQYTK
jgi:shikimate kinase